MCLRHKVCRLQKGMVNNMTKKQKKMLYRIIVTFLLFAVLMVCEHTGGMDGWNKIVLFVIYLVPYLVIGYDIVYKAARNISHGQVFDENFLMMIATFGAFGVGEYSEAVAVMLFYQVGELFQGYAVGKSRQSISDMMDICPEYANIEEDGVLKLRLPRYWHIPDKCPSYQKWTGGIFQPHSPGTVRLPDKTA